jgi:spore coat protein SA
MLEPWKRRLRQSYARDAARLCSKLGAQLIHIHNDPEAVQPLRRHNPAATLVLHMNNDHLLEGDSSQVATEAVATADWIAFCSTYLMQGALNKIESLRRDRCFVIHNGADLIMEPRQPTNRFKSEKGPVILFVGRIVQQKGVHVLLEAMPHVLPQFPGATIKIVGGVRFGDRRIDAYLTRLQANATALGSRVEFVGPVSHSGVNKFFQEADVFVCPSLWNEPLGMVNLEAMGAGVPVVAFANGGIPEALGNAGVLVPEANATALAAALNRLLHDPDQRKDLALRGRERVAKLFTWDIIAQQWQGHLERWMEHGRSRS